MTKDPAGNQRALDLTDVFLRWTRCMKAKPAKCRSLAAKAFTAARSRIKPFTRRQYSSFDPKLSISGQPIPFIRDEPFKFLGRQIYHNLSEKKQAMAVSARFSEHLRLVDEQPLTGAMKIWLYQHYILAYLSWPFLIYDFSIPFAKDMQKAATRFLKRWLRINQKANVSILYRSRENKGLQLCAVSTCLKRCQVTRAHLIKHSADPVMSQLHQLKLRSDQKIKRDWKPTVALEKAEADVNFRIRFQGQHGRTGLGLIPIRCPPPDSPEYRRLVTATVCKEDEHELLVRVMDFAMQGAWRK